MVPDKATGRRPRRSLTISGAQHDATSVLERRAHTEIRRLDADMRRVRQPALLHFQVASVGAGAFDLRAQVVRFDRASSCLPRTARRARSRSSPSPSAAATMIFAAPMIEAGSVSTSEEVLSSGNDLEIRTGALGNGGRGAAVQISRPRGAVCIRAAAYRPPFFSPVERFGRFLYLSDLLRDAQLRASGPRVALNLFRGGKNRLAGDDFQRRIRPARAYGKPRRARACPRMIGEYLFDHAVFERMVADHEDAPFRVQPAHRGFEPAAQHRKLRVHFDAQAPETSASRDALPHGAPMRGWPP